MLFRSIFICGAECNIPDGVSIAEIKDDLILLECNTSTRTFLDSEFKKRGFFSRPKFELATSPQIVGFAARNMGIGCVVADFAKREKDLGKVREIKVNEPLPPRNICVLRGNDVRSLAADRLFEMILNGAGQQMRR